MEIRTLVNLFDRPDEAAGILKDWRLSDPAAARHALLDLAEAGVPLDLLANLCGQLTTLLPETADPGSVVEGVRQFILASRSPLSFAALAERDPTTLPMLVRVLDWGGVWRETILRDPEAYDFLRLTEGQPVERAALAADVTAEATLLLEERSVMAALRRIKRREQLRIVYGERVGKHKPELVWQQLTYLAEAVVAAALGAAQQKQQSTKPATTSRRTIPLGPMSVIALGRCGAGEQDYGDVLQLLLIHAPLPVDDSQRRAAQDQYERIARLVIRLLSEATDLGVAYKVELQSLPGRETAPASIAANEAAALLDELGRTWHRQAFTQARCIAGDAELAEHFLQQIEPWIYRRLLSPADEAGLRALKRRIVRRSELAAGSQDRHDIELGPGGLLDFEQTLQFLRLLRGGDQHGARLPATLAAIAGLEQAGAISVSERTALENTFLELRRELHRAQASANPSTNNAIPPGSRDLIRGLLQAAFSEEPDPPPEVDLLLAPHPTREEATEILSPYRFQDCFAALRHLNDLASERTTFLSTRRCRYYLSAIIGRLLEAIAATPQPDLTLATLSRVSDSLGSKGVLWELFAAHQPSLELYVRVCGCSPYLSDLLVSHPGMLDELLDSLQLARQPELAELERIWQELCRGGRPALPLLHGFKASRHLQIGVRDILQRDPLEATHRALNDVAEVCLNAIAQHEYDRLVEKYGQPAIQEGPLAGQPCGGVILGLGKFGGQEPNYHSDLEVAFLYDAEGMTEPPETGRRVQATANSHFFTQLAQRVLKEVSQSSPHGRLFPVEASLRPMGGAGPLASSLDDLTAYFQSGSAPITHWQALCKARPVFGPATSRAAAMRAIRQLLTGRTWQRADALHLLEQRLQLERGASPLNLKRGSGGTLDVEFVVQRLQLEHAAKKPRVLEPNTLAAIEALAAAGVLAKRDAEWWSTAYRTLRRIEGGIRLLNSRDRHQVPSDPADLQRLAMLLGYSSAEELSDYCQHILAENRIRFLAAFGDALAMQEQANESAP
jgi:glutamate-ammonia-ligase adenylyltransferase